MLKNSGICYAPVSGKVLQISEEGVLIQLPFWTWRKRLALPTRLEILNVIVESGKMVISARDSSHEEWSMSLSRHHWWQRRPKVVLIPGDRGQAKAYFGRFPLGGLFLLSPPKKYKLWVNKSDNILCGETILAVREESTQNDFKNIK